jgi:hypothetical protein
MPKKLAMTDGLSPKPQDTAEAPADKLDVACRALSAHRKRPLLVMYYPPYARMTESDLQDLYDVLRGADLRPEKPLAQLDTLIESYGGDPTAGYRLAQLVRTFCTDMHVLVAEHAYSAATLFSFAGSQVRLAHFAGLSPIDLSLVSESGKRRLEVELATIDNIVDFAVTARKKVEELLQELECKGTTNVDSDILVEMVKQVGALQVGKYFRERVLTGFYAEELLGKYMFGKHLDKQERWRHVIENFLMGAPGHEVHLDYHLSRKWGLEVCEMRTEESDLAKTVAATLEELARHQVICSWLSRSERMPLIQFYPQTQTAPIVSPPSASDQTEEKKKEETREPVAN